MVSKTIRFIQTNTTATWVVIIATKRCSRAKAITDDSQGTHHQTGPARIGRTIKSLHEGINTMQTQKPQDTVGLGKDGINIAVAILNWWPHCLRLNPIRVIIFTR